METKQRLENASTAPLCPAKDIPVLLFAGVIADTLGIETVMYLLAAAILGFSWWTE
jgi:hypothetical protein